MSELPRRVGLLGGGVIGGGWAARFLLHGVDVVLYDPDPGASRKVGEVLANARRSVPRLMAGPMPAEGALTFVGSPEEAAEAVDFVQESAPERLELKQDLLARADKAAPPDLVFASSTSGLLPSRLQERMRHPERLVVGHPFNPVYLLPLVEMCAGRVQREGAVDEAAGIYRSIGMHPLVLDTEIDGFVADRLMEALWREALWLVHEGVATVGQIDDAVRFGAGLRWSAMGTFLLYRLAGGEGGMRHFIDQFGPALQWPWTKLVDVPELTDDLVDRIVEQSDAQAGGLTLRQLEALRDDSLVAVMHGLRTVGFAAGEVVAEHDERLSARVAGQTVDRGGAAVADHEFVEEHDRHVAVVWADGHRSTFHHLWLRDNCPCAECVHPQTRERTLDTFSLDPGIAPIAVQEAPGALAIEWPDGHRSSYDMAWLRATCSCATCRTSDLPPHRLWGAELAADLPEFDYAEVMATDAGLLRFVETIWTVGVGFVRDASNEQQARRDLPGRVGQIRETNFGPDFHVELPTGFQFLPCLVAEAPGGGYTLADGFWVADRIRADDPDSFRLLCDVPIPYRVHDETHDLRITAPVISRRPDGGYGGIRFDNALMSPLDVPLGLVEPLYTALRRFNDVARSDAAQITVRPREGDVMVFHNHRVLHGRTAFGPGLYVDGHEWRSRLRVLRRT
jgi:carnitine 3-dehydrogenase